MLIFAAIVAILVYDHVLSIEHEDNLLAREEGLSKAAHFLQDVVISQPPAAVWWI
jgi:sugar phosphate isomerase/epimerase